MVTSILPCGQAHEESFHTILLTYFVTLISDYLPYLLYFKPKMPIKRDFYLAFKLLDFNGPWIRNMIKFDKICMPQEV